MKPIIIQAAISGSITTTDKNRNVPMSLEENVDAALSSVEAGASVLHLHAREEDGEPTQSIDRYRELLEAVRSAGCEAVLNLSTGSAAGRADGAARYECLELEPEMGSFDCGSFNFGERVFINSMPFLRDMAQEFLDRGVKPEIEIFDVGNIGSALELRDEGLLEEPLHFQFVLGVRGGAPATPEVVSQMRAMLPESATWSACGIGRHQLPMNLLTLAIGGGAVRTGLEDNIYYTRGVPAESNAQLVERVVGIAAACGIPVATPDQARELLSLPPRA